MTSVIGLTECAFRALTTTTTINVTTLPSCGGSAALFAASPESGLAVDKSHSGIEVVLAYIDSCYADGGPSIGNRADTPELPYLRAVLADVRSAFCASTGKVTIAGENTGAWEAQTLACAAGDEIRGVATFGGGQRAVRPPCKGSAPTLFIAHTNDSGSPLGPLAPSDQRYVVLGSPGLIPRRDEVLAANACQGTDTQPWDPAYPACRAYAGCPAATPVVWCEIGGVSQTPDLFNGVHYLSDDLWSFLKSLP